MMSPQAWSASLPKLQEMSEALPDAVTIVGSNTKPVFNPLPTAPMFSTRLWSGVIEHDIEDQVVVAWAGTPIRELQTHLRLASQSLAIPATGHALVDGVPGTVGGLIAANLPHGLSGPLRSPKDWVLGVAIIRADGTIARAGSKAVKSVAGYDVHRLMAGARGTLGLIAAAAFRVHPLRGIPTPQAEALKPWNGEPVWIQRVAPTDYEIARATASQLFAADPESATLWHTAPPFRFSGDWVLGPNGETSPESAPAALAAQARAVLDPQRRFNPHILP